MILNTNSEVEKKKKNIQTNIKKPKKQTYLLISQSLLLVNDKMSCDAQHRQYFF